MILFISYVYNVVSFFYVVFERTPLLLNSIHITFGMLTIYFAWLIAYEVWNDRSAAKKSALIIAFFPPLIMYSSVTLREIVVVLFIQLFTLFYLRWNESGRIKNLLFSIMSASTNISGATSPTDSSNSAALSNA